jgi:hypothetical protein
MSDFDIPFDRVTFRDGQPLTARDLRDAHRRRARLRRLHLRYLHGTWGIALGFQVRRSTDGRAVEVGPGYAIDPIWRDILLADGVRVPAPAAGAAVLTARYREDEPRDERAGLEAVCHGEGLDPRHERPAFAWRSARDVRFGVEVPLVRVVVANGVIQGSLGLRVRRYARALVRPHIGAGSTEPGRTAWRPWTAQHVVLGLEVTVDTTEAGFTSTPCYFAQLRGDVTASPRLVVPELSPVRHLAHRSAATGAPPSSPTVAVGFVAAATPTGFTYRVPLAQLPPLGVPLSRAQALRRGWSVEWLGVEPVVGGEPAPDRARLFALSGHLLSTVMGLHP